MDNSRQDNAAASKLLFEVGGFIAQSAGGAGDEALFNRLALELFAFQFTRVPIYRAFCERRGIAPESVKNWHEIPALPVAAFKEHAVSSLAENDRARVFHSSGTTGHVPSRHFHNAASLSIYEASSRSWFERHFLPGGAMAGMVFLAPPPEFAPHSSLVHMFATVDGPRSNFAGKIATDGAWTLDFDELENATRAAIAGKKPLGLLGAAFSFVHWLDELAARKIRLKLPAGSRIMETGGYKGRSRAVSKADLHRLMTRCLGVPDSHIVTEYGMSELSSQAYDHTAGETRAATGIFHFPPWARAQVISPETGAIAKPGDPGLLRIFDLANIHSVMALQTEDLAVAREDGFELLGRAESAEARGCSLMAATT